MACCAGLESCARTTITGTQQAQFYASRCGERSSITGVPLIKSYAYQALDSAVIDSDGETDMTVQMYADEAGLNSNVICRSGSTCNLACKGTGCSGLTYQCLAGSTCNITPTGCLSDNSVSVSGGVTCPTFTTTLTLRNMDEIGVDDNDQHAKSPTDVAADMNNIHCEAKGSCKSQVLSAPNYIQWYVIYLF